MTSSQRPRLPQELYRPIIEEVHAKSDLYNLLFVSSNILGEAERVLYRVLVVDHADFSRRIQLLRRIINSDRIALFVQSLRISSVSTNTEFYWSIVNQALRAVKNLKKLTILGGLYHPPSCLLSGCTFLLRYLSVYNILPANQATLEAQTELEELEVPYSRGPQFSQQSFPRLSILSNSSFQESAFPNARHTVTRLQLISGIPSIDGRPFHRIKSFSVHLHTTQNVLSRILAPFPSLRYLQCSVIDSFEPVTVAILDRTANLTHLKKLYLHSRLTPNTLDPDSLDFSVVFSNIQSLRTIVVHIHANTEENCIELVRDVPGFKFVPSYLDGWKDSCWIDA